MASAHALTTDNADALFSIDGRQVGPRILTVLLYLNEVEAGGGTEFPDLDVVVQPKVGRVAVWPHVLNEAVNTRDVRTVHASLPVEAGVKYGSNIFFHLRNFKDPEDTGCNP